MLGQKPSALRVDRGSIMTYQHISTQRLQKFIYLHLLTGCFMKISLQSSELNGISIILILYIQQFGEDSMYVALVT